ncbi:MAG: thioredoxin domain-containing protein [Clostridia bacterium]|nr:thioredoxin domain-containing protein [Clostridia bacterium]
MSNRLQHETSPYLRQHASNPVDWYPWSQEAFDRARQEDKPIFLSIGYSTCHWCHVMARESFEDAGIARLLNDHFISIKVDKEERPDIDSVYMSACMAFMGSGGWPTSIFMTPDQQPFFAGTYFPKFRRGGMIGFDELLTLIHEKWMEDRQTLLDQAQELMAQLTQPEEPGPQREDLPAAALRLFAGSYDVANGGFGRAPKFPAPHNLLFLMEYHRRHPRGDALKMVEHTLWQMYRGGLFDHIGFGFSRYSTDGLFLAPHFEKMLYDNALLILAYARAYAMTGRERYLSVAQKTAAYILREMTAPQGGFYSAQDADAQGEEGRYYLLTPQEVKSVLGEAEGEAFCRQYGITYEGNFEGKSIPNLLGSDPQAEGFERLLPQLYAYRKRRCLLHLDDKILASWNGLMIAALCQLYRLSRKGDYLQAARKAEGFIREYMMEAGRLFTSYAGGQRGAAGFLEDYAALIYAQTELYQVTFEKAFLAQAEALCRQVLAQFEDEAGGFFLYGHDAPPLILRPKETYDGATPSGNALMAWNLVRLFYLTGKERYGQAAQRQLDFLAEKSAAYPAGHAMFLMALMEWEDPSDQITVVLASPGERKELPFQLPLEANVTLLDRPDEAHPLKEGKTTYYVCRGRQCDPPTNTYKAP